MQWDIVGVTEQQPSEWMSENRYVVEKISEGGVMRGLADFSIAGDLTVEEVFVPSEEMLELEKANNLLVVPAFPLDDTKLPEVERIER